jgi:hypothetical protein
MPLPCSGFRMKSKIDLLNNQDHYEEVYERLKSRNEQKRFKLPASFKKHQRKILSHNPVFMGQIKAEGRHGIELCKNATIVREIQASMSSENNNNFSNAALVVDVNGY